MEIKDRTIALLIDSDNVSCDYFSILLDELSQYGRVTYRRLYGDFTNGKANGWKPALLNYSIEQIQQVAFTTGKNATDSKMIIDAMDILYKGNVDCFCLATSDSDFTNLAMRFRNEDLIVIGAGEEKTPSSFRNSCDIFIQIDKLLKAKKNEEQKQNGQPIKQKGAEEAVSAELKKKQEQLIRVARQIVEDGADTDGWMHFAAFMNEIWRKENDFNPMLYGAQSGKPIPFFKNLKTEEHPVFSLEKIDNIDKIRIHPSKKKGIQNVSSTPAENRRKQSKKGKKA